MNDQATTSPRLPVYFDRMIDAFHAGHAGRHAHLGHWHPSTSATDQPTGLAAAQETLNDELIRMGNVQNGTRVLDVACGFGGLIQQLDASVTDSELHGVNIDDRQLDICQQLRSNNDNVLRWQEADACDLPFADETFDTVFCVEAMFHFSSRKRFLDEAHRIMMSGGTLVVTDFAMRRPGTLPAFCLEAVLCDGYGPWPDPWCSHGTALQLLESPAWLDLQHVDATSQTLPSYHYIVPSDCDMNHDPVDPAARSAMLLQWLHTNGHLRYDYLSAVARESQ
jgi:MPBQ/MSBQ methyltransferase